MDELRATLQALRDGFGLDLPEFLTGFYGGYTAKPWDGPDDVTDEPLPLSALLSQVLQAFALQYEQEATASLCYSANVLRLLDEDGVTVGQLPRRSGVAIEPIRAAVGILAKRGFITAASDPGVRGTRVRLTGNGLEARACYRELPGEIEARWAARFGVDTVQRLRSRLEALATPCGVRRAPLWLGLVPPQGTWRSKVRRPDELAHFPMPRQSGHPDGA